VDTPLWAAGAAAPCFGQIGAESRSRSPQRGQRIIGEQNSNLVLVAIQCVAEAAHAVPDVTIRFEDDVVAASLTLLRVVREETD
jgi:hypothetical protein